MDLPPDVWADMLEDAGEDTALLRLEIYLHIDNSTNMFRDHPNTTGAGHYQCRGYGDDRLYNDTAFNDSSGCGWTAYRSTGYGEMMYTNNLYEESGDANTRIEPPF